MCGLQCSLIHGKSAISEHEIVKSMGFVCLCIHIISSYEKEILEKMKNLK